MKMPILFSILPEILRGAVMKRSVLIAFSLLFTAIVHAAPPSFTKLGADGTEYNVEDVISPTTHQVLAGASFNIAVSALPFEGFCGQLAAINHSGDCSFAAGAILEVSESGCDMAKVSEVVTVGDSGTCHFTFVAKNYDATAIWEEEWIIVERRPTDLDWSSLDSSYPAYKGVEKLASLIDESSSTEVSGAQLTYLSQSPGICIVESDVIIAVKAGSCSVKVSFAGDDNFKPVERVFSWSFFKNESFINGASAPAEVFVEDEFSISKTTGTANLPVKIEADEEYCTVVDGTAFNTATIRALKAGTCTLSYSAEANDLYEAPTAVVEAVEVKKLVQSISATSPATAYVNDTFSVSAVVSPSGNAVSVNASGSCTGNGSLVGNGQVQITATSAGNCILNFVTAEDDKYLSASESVSVEINKHTQVISVSPAGYLSILVGDSETISTSSNATNNPISGQVVSGTQYCSLSTSAQSYVVEGVLEGVCTIEFTALETSTYLSASAQLDVQVYRRNQTIAAMPDVQKFVFDGYTVSGITSSAGLPVDIAVAGSGCTASISANSAIISSEIPTICTVTYSQDGDDRFNPADNISQQIEFIKRPQSITASYPAVGQVGTEITVSASAEILPVKITVSNGCQLVGTSPALNSASVLLTSVSACTFHFVQEGSARYEPATLTSSMQVLPGEQTITVTQSAPEFISIDDEFIVSATASSGLAVEFSASGNCAVISASGGQARIRGTAEGDCIVVFAQSGNANYLPAVSIEQEVRVLSGQYITVEDLPYSAKFGQTIQASATASSGLPVTITVDGCVFTNAPPPPEPPVVDPENPEVVPEPQPEPEPYSEIGTASIDLNAVGSCVVTFTQAGDNYHEPAPTVTRTVLVERWNQTIQITLEPPMSHQADTVFSIEAVVMPPYSETQQFDSQRYVQFSVSGDCAIVDDTVAGRVDVKLNATGTSCVVYMNQPGNALYLPAPQVVRTVVLSFVTDGEDLGEFWTTNKLFTTGMSANGVRQPIMSPPMVARDGKTKANSPNLMVVFGTGQYHGESDLPVKAVQSIYGVHDRGVYNLARYKTVSENNAKPQLAKRTFTEETVTSVAGSARNRKVAGENVDWANQFGWYIDLGNDADSNGLISELEGKGERSVFRPFIANRLYVFNTVIPTVGTCTGATEGWTMLIDWSTGLAPNFATYDANMDGTIDSNDAGFVGYYNETAGSELGRGGDNIYDTSGSEARRRSVMFGAADEGVRLSWEEKQPYGVIAE